jgi:serine protease
MCKRWCWAILLIGIATQAGAVPIVVKLRERSGAFLQWERAGRSGMLSELSAVLGVHSARPLVPEGLLHALRQRAQQAQQASRGASAQIERLRQIAILELPSAVDTALLLRKLARHPAVEYAEALPERRICGVPNDPLVAEQYALRLIRAFDAWELLPQGAQPVIVGVVDTGVDPQHPDLADNIFLNPGETGLDDQGRDRRTNGVDDDGNGFVDDWWGWDFAAGDGSLQDNDPRPGNSHGTHVAGIIGAVVNNARGIAGVVPSVRLLVVKIGPDNPASPAIYNSYQGVLYAAAMGAQVINCSWGGPGRSESEHDVIRTAAALGAAIVAAAGNDGMRAPFYPAAYPEVLSVAATDSADNKSYYSNYHATVGVTAPGDDILSTLPGGLYGRMSGTSMAAPVASGVVALVRQSFPSYSAEQALARVMKSADNIERQQPWLAGLLGWGRVNAYRALAESTLYFCRIDSLIIEDADGDGFFDRNDELLIRLRVRNVLDALDSASLEVFTPLVPSPQYLVRRVNVEALAPGEARWASEALRLRLPQDIPDNTVMELRFSVRRGSELVGRTTASVVLRPSYRTLAANNIAVTFNSIGNIAFNDYPDNTQGDGFRYRSSMNLLFEGALMVGISPERLSNVARGAMQTQQDRSFVARQALQLWQPGTQAAAQAEAIFADEQRPGDLGVEVRQRIYQFAHPEEWRDFVLVLFDILNRTSERFDSMYAGWYLDWDIGPSALGDRAVWDDSSAIGYVYHEERPGYPMGGAVVVSNQGVNFFAVDNDGRSNDNPGVYDGFTRAEKWRMMSSGIARKRSSRTDASMVIAAGPIRLLPGDTARVALALVAGMTVEELRRAATAARQAAASLGVDTIDWRFLPQRLQATIRPSVWTPGNPLPRLRVELPEQRYLRVLLVDALGRLVDELFAGRGEPGALEQTLPVSALGSGVYFIYLLAGREGMVVPLQVVR